MTLCKINLKIFWLELFMTMINIQNQKSLRPVFKMTISAGYRLFDTVLPLTSSNNFKTVSKLALLKIALYLDRTEDAENLLDSSKLKTINTNNWKRQMLYALNNKDRDFNSSLGYLKSICNK